MFKTMFFTKLYKKLHVWNSLYLKKFYASGMVASCKINFFIWIFFIGLEKLSCNWFFTCKSCHSLNLFLPIVEWLHGPNGVKPCYASISTLSILHDEPTLDTHSLKMHNFEICQKNMSKSLMIFFLTPAWLEKIVRSRNTMLKGAISSPLKCDFQEICRQ